MPDMKPLQLKAYEYMKEKIQESYFKAGVIYSETKIAAEIGVSRTPFRDAIHRLMQEGYVDIIPSKGFRIHETNLADVVETFQIRAAIEGYCAMMAAREAGSKNSKELCKVLRELLEKQRECAAAEDIKELVKYDNAFHTQLVKSADNAPFSEMLRLNMYRIGTFATSTLAKKGRVKQTLEEHERILAAMESGDWKDAVDAVQAHMERPKTMIMQDQSLWKC